MSALRFQVLLRSVPELINRSYASKPKDRSAINIWNYENKILFGPKKQNSNSTTKAKQSRSKKVNAESNDANTNSPIDNRLKEMYEISERTHSNFDQMESLSKTTNIKLSKGKVKETVPKKSKNSVKELDSNDISNKPDNQVQMPSHPTEIDFILQCPLIPNQDYEVPSSVQDFEALFKSFQLRDSPSVSTILNRTRSDLSNFFLKRWRLGLVKELGEDGFKKHQDATIWQGITLHASIQQYLTGTPLSDVNIQTVNEGHWKSLASVLPAVTEVEVLESSVRHPWIMYKGTLDCIAKLEDTLYLIDWKTSEKPKPLLSNLYDNPLQVAAYLGAVNHTAEFVDRFGFVERAAIVVAYNNGQQAHVHKLQPALCQVYWRQWCERLHQYWCEVAAQKLG